MTQAPITRPDADTDIDLAAPRARRRRRRRRGARHDGDRCTMCGRRVQVDRDGRCSLGHQVVSRAEIATRLADLDAADDLRSREQAVPERVVDLTTASEPLPATAPSFSVPSPTLARQLADLAKGDVVRHDEGPDVAQVPAADRQVSAADDMPVLDPAPPLPPEAVVPHDAEEDEAPLIVATAEVAGGAAGARGDADANAETPAHGLLAATLPALEPDSPWPTVRRGPLGIDDLDPSAPSVMDVMPSATVEPRPLKAWEQRLEVDAAEEQGDDAVPPGDVIAPRSPWQIAVAGLFVVALLAGAWYLAVNL